MSEFNNQNPSAADYLGDVLRGNVPVNQLIPQHPYILDTLGLAEAFEKNTTHIMLLTLDEAQSVIEDLDNSKPVILATTYAGNIKDSIAGAKNISKLVSYTDAGKLVYRLKGLGIKAIQYQYGGQVYVKITGYASLRRILQGTRYKINSPQILELGIGKAGINGGILEGAKFCIWFSLAYRTVQLIFKSDHDVAAFIGNITMDIAKIIVTIFVTKILVAVSSSLAVTFSVTVPIAVGIFAIIAVGFFITWALDELDKKYHLSDKLISAIREGMRTQAEIEKWNFEHTSPFTYGLMNTHW
ncbi:membrane protein [Hafnia alvei FB1]|uniref:Membrane protein n=1 Tax=Hafnia alvei FB1 TaxID=1453496 RepID=A0A097QZ99_HAFAL|nr:hypothetical protein [Hafnia alvei]AIU71819.1 membrane protein [Hafnia alvei FB1]TBL63110.1 hypothetical protein EYY92_02730 [Hafnia alvei]